MPKESNISSQHRKGSRRLELLAPAANAEVAIAAIEHGADAVYMGATSHGARKSAANSIDDIARVVEFAHQFRSRVYVTVNTIVYEDEIRKVETLCRDLYHAGVDALIVQDMGLLRMNLPPIALHASTQCDIRTPEKAKFLEEVGFSQLVLARELTLEEIKRIVDTVSVPVECFIHGALCVSYSGRCHASCAATGRSANRGECAQLCRLPYTLTDSKGKILARDKYLLSLRDFNASQSLPDLIEAGVSSFKIEGRLKEMDYVKNVTSFYDLKLNRIIEANGGKYRRSSFGSVDLSFTPSPEKSFNRGFTEYFLHSRKPASIASILTPKSMGEPISDPRELHNGDGISFFDKSGVYQGVNINRVDNGKIIPGRRIDIPKGTTLHRTFDVEWQKQMARDTSKRRISVDIALDSEGVSACDERGVKVRLPLDVTREEAQKDMDYRQEFAKLGNTIYRLREYSSTLGERVFIPRSEIGNLRRKLIEMLDLANMTTYPLDLRRPENPEAKFPCKRLDFRDNVANSLAESLYRDHGVAEIEPAMEVTGNKRGEKRRLMTTRHCILRELGMCLKGKGDGSGNKVNLPLTLTGGDRRYDLKFNCKDCEMQLYGEG